MAIFISALPLAASHWLLPASKPLHGVPAFIRVIRRVRRGRLPASLTNRLNGFCRARCAQAGVVVSKVASRGMVPVLRSCCRDALVKKRRPGPVEREQRAFTSYRAVTGLASHDVVENRDGEKARDHDARKRTRPWSCC
jgi:hypothetical protein